MEMVDPFLGYTPCLDGILADICQNHLCLRVGAVHILLKDSITRCDMRNAMNKLSEFVLQMEDLYGKGAMTFNVHQLLHLPKSVAKLGPL
ncbi:hypothetical protein HPB48_017951 [Haemaphysalis longicornis]|uniref:Uncharacterized protein n=1 Tax=Haemaphysalis longicornis TaxID=44386 RepID=A0A9J6GJ18_HAELO|nr:hypothetical protein HPB48_017951 [Haemaphysalis longicornis]